MDLAKQGDGAAVAALMLTAEKLGDIRGKTLRGFTPRK
jgi:hypothetical protein